MPVPEISPIQLRWMEFSLWCSIKKYIKKLLSATSLSRNGTIVTLDNPHPQNTLSTVFIVTTFCPRNSPNVNNVVYWNRPTSLDKHSPPPHTFQFNLLSHVHCMAQHAPWVHVCLCLKRTTSRRYRLCVFTCVLMHSNLCSMLERLKPVFMCQILFTCRWELN